MKKIIICNLLVLSSCSIIINKIVHCGNQELDAREECDDGNTFNGDGCDENCNEEVTICGDTTINQNEECDDGNTLNGDGCNANCEIEPICGNKRKEAPEECDDGGFCSDNTKCDSEDDCDGAPCIPRSGDGCSAQCTLEGLCGNGLLDQDESCDDSNFNNNDGCTFNCQKETCGDGIVVISEQCDNLGHCDGDPNEIECAADSICQQQQPPLNACLPLSGDGCDESCKYEACDLQPIDLQPGPNFPLTILPPSTSVFRSCFAGNQIDTGGREISFLFQAPSRGFLTIRTLGTDEEQIEVHTTENACAGDREFVDSLCATEINSAVLGRVEFQTDTIENPDSFIVTIDTPTNSTFDFSVITQIEVEFTEQ